MYIKKEKLIDDIPRGFGSRPTIFKFINLAVNKKYLLKIPDTNFYCIFQINLF